MKDIKQKDWFDQAWLGLGDISKLQYDNPFLKQRTQKDLAYPELFYGRFMRNPEYLSFACKALLNVNLLPFQAAILEELWIRPFPMFIATRGGSKSFLLAVYALLKCILYSGTQIVIVGAAFRQAKVVFAYMETIWYNAPIFQSVCSQNSGPRHDIDRYLMRINDSIVTAIPLGDGQKIRGLRANIIISDEFGSIPPSVYETVVSGFAVVSSDPVTNVKEAARRDAMSKLGIWTADAEKKYKMKGGNQAILSGTASYDFEHFSEYWKRYCAIVKSCGNEEKLKEVLRLDELPNNFNWRDYSVIRIPYELIPEGFMDDKQVIRAKATMDSGIYQREYGAVFTSDSNGFFKRSLIESCVTSEVNPIQLPSGSVWFDAKLSGSSSHKYVMGIDPASEQDNFSIIILELREDHTRIVYCWTTNKKNFRERAGRGLTDKSDYFGFCARKIRELMKLFPCEALALDTQGGGYAIAEALHDPDKMVGDELPLWPTIEPDKKQETDNFSGKHIIHMCQFVRAEWTAEANHGLRKDMEDKVLLFPRFDPLTLEISAEETKNRHTAWKVVHNDDTKFNIYDTLEDCVMEIEELKDELSTIVITRTSTGVGARDKWDVPEIKLPNGKKGRIRKDRYSALVMANMVARQIHRAPPVAEYTGIGGFARDLAQRQIMGQRGYSGPDWFVQTMGSKPGILIGKANTINRGYR